jgi:hypothetical protein
MLYVRCITCFEPKIKGKKNLPNTVTCVHWAITDGSHQYCTGSHNCWQHFFSWIVDRKRICCTTEIIIIFNYLMFKWSIWTIYFEGQQSKGTNFDINLLIWLPCTVCCQEVISDNYLHDFKSDLMDYINRFVNELTKHQAIN